MTRYILGLDLSLTATGAVLVPVDWGGDWRKVFRDRSGYSPPGKTKRDAKARADYESNVPAWEARRRHCIATCVQSLVPRHCPVSVAVEDVFLGANVQTLVGLCLLQGAVLERLTACALHAHTASTIRALLLGTANGRRAEVKDQTRRTLIAAGAPDDWTEDEYDAFAAANVQLMHEGGLFFSCPTPGSTPETKTPRQP